MWLPGTHGTYSCMGEEVKGMVDNPQMHELWIYQE